ncbi:uncharacterized protein LOC131151450 [Malania oleifera]|uniref:uncharacterized protein LOC131151450 n=1 Tax=Malania oleifera TaxID=397392 RepID=UPI0025AE0351|nr:uncharacterized protein LOC131151450 [Malania oleifera]
MDSRGKAVIAGGDNHVDTFSDADVDALFIRANLPAFSRGLNLIVGEDLIQEMEELLGVLECTEEQKVRFATFKLAGEVRRWWRSAKLVEEQRPGYFLIATKDVKAEEFLHLTQRPKNVQQYAVRFLELSYFALHMVSDEPKKARMFKRGLRQSVQSQVVALLMQSFTDLVDRAMAIEASI